MYESAIGGLAYSPNESAYPDLWRGLSYSFVPNIGAREGKVYDIASRRFVPQYTLSGSRGSPFGGQQTVNFEAYSRERGYVFTTVPPFSTSFLEFTVSAWVRRSSNAKYDTIFSSQRTAADTNTAIKFRFNEAADTVTLIVNYNASNKRILANAPARIVAGQWAHVAMTLKQQTLYYFANGTTRNETNTTVTGTLGNTSSTGLYVGHDHPATYSGTENSLIGFNGNIGELLVYNRALSPGEISIISKGHSPFTPARVVYGKGSIASARPWLYYQQLRRVA